VSELDRELKTQVISYACKFRIYPTDEQKLFFKKQFGCCRFIYNYLLIRVEKAYSRRKEYISAHQAKKFISPLKKTTRYSFLKEVNSQSLQAAAINLGRARERFFNKEAGYPKLKKKSGRQSFEIPQNFLLKKSKKGNDFLFIPKLKSSIKMKVHREMRGSIRHIVISMEPDGKYYASLNCRREEYCVTLFDPKMDNNSTGYDLGLSDLYASEKGEKVRVPRFLRKLETTLAKAQKRFSNKKRGSANKKKAQLKVAKVHSKIKNKRKDFIHKQSNKIVNENQVIYFETLNIRGMMRNHCLAKSAVDATLGEFVRQCRYKARWRGKKIIQIGRFEPSSKLCSNCGEKNNELKLHHRTWRCKNCHALHDRDVNAAINIKKIGQDMSKFTPVERSTAECLLVSRQTSWLEMKEAGNGS
jgi:putative transposase